MTDDKKLMLIALGIGAFYVMSRQRYAQQPVMPGRSGSNAQNLGGVAQLINSIGGLFRGGSSSPIASGPYAPGASRDVIDRAANAANNDENPDLNGSVMDYGNDGLAVNPVNVSAYDYAQQWMG